jgi:hypothetical protein
MIVKLIRKTVHFKSILTQTNSNVTLSSVHDLQFIYFKLRIFLSVFFSSNIFKFEMTSCQIKQVLCHKATINFQPTYARA